jgi:hypothetical protein
MSQLSVKLFCGACILVLCCGLLACGEQKTETVEVDFGYDYFPLAIGKSWTYQVDSIFFDPAIGGTAIDTIATFLQETIVDTFTNLEGRITYRAEQLYRRSPLEDWQLVKVFTLSQDEARAFRTEDNLTFVKMTFPPRAGNQWDGNAFFDEFLKVNIRGEQLEFFKSWDYLILETGSLYELDTLRFEQHLIIQNADDENLIERRFALERYARGVGLITRELEILDTQCEVCCNSDFALCEGLPWLEKAEKGLILKQRLIDYR